MVEVIADFFAGIIAGMVAGSVADFLAGVAGYAGGVGGGELGGARGGGHASDSFHAMRRASGICPPDYRTYFLICQGAEVGKEWVARDVGVHARGWWRAGSG